MAPQSCLENPVDGGAWWAAVHGVAKSWTWLSDFSFTFQFLRIAEGNGNPLQCSCLENPRDGGAWWAAIYGVTQSRTWLKRLSSSSSSRASLVAQMVKHLPTMQETRVWSLGGEDPLEKEMATHFSILAWRIPWTKDLVGYSPWGHKESDTTERLHSHTLKQTNRQWLTIRRGHWENVTIGWSRAGPWQLEFSHPLHLAGKVHSAHHGNHF